MVRKRMRRRQSTTGFAEVSLAEFVVKDQGGNDLAVNVIGNGFVGVVNRATVTIKIVSI